MCNTDWNVLSRCDLATRCAAEVSLKLGTARPVPSLADTSLIEESELVVV